MENSSTPLQNMIILKYDQYYLSFPFGYLMLTDAQNQLLFELSERQKGHLAHKKIALPLKNNSHFLTVENTLPNQQIWMLLISTKHHLCVKTSN